jgi:hypothetical protein
MTQSGGVRHLRHIDDERPSVPEGSKKIGAANVGRVNAVLLVRRMPPTSRDLIFQFHSVGLCG